MELQRFEERYLSADEKIKALEYEIFMSLREEVASCFPAVLVENSTAVWEYTDADAVYGCRLLC
ncbi:MAG: hypothetical protein Q9M89_03775 [Persephonella sp.]|nr:hypothetical protein [Persephonella sp.]